MKLDNIIYDVDKLGAAIQSDLINESATFNAMYPSQTATELVNVLSGYSTMLQYNMVSALANCYTDTAYSPTGIYQLAETLGNRLHGNISSQLTCTVTRGPLQDTGETITIPAGSIFNVEGLEFFNKESISFDGTRFMRSDVTLIQGKKNVTEKIASGIAGERFYFSENFECNTNMVEVTVRGEKWNVLDSFLSLNTYNMIDMSQANAVVLRTDPDGRSYIKVGSGSNASIPSSGAPIQITWVSNQGANGNITKSNANITLVTPIFYTTTQGQNVQLEVFVTSSTPATGGFNTQSLMTLKDSSPYVFASGDRAVRRSDYKALLLNKCGYQTCNVWGEYEQAALQGMYNKTMMNMVYYSGIKSYQKYELRKVATLELDKTSVDFYKVPKVSVGYMDSDPKSWYYETNSSSSSARGFLGSYEFTIDTYDRYNNEISVMYADKQGTGILTLDYQDNKEVIDKDEYESYIIDDLGPDLSRGLINEPNVIDQDNCMYGYSTPVIVELYNQDANPSLSLEKNLFHVTTEDTNDYVFSGTYNGQSTIVLPNNPIQIMFTFSPGREINNVKPTSIDPDASQVFVDGGVITGFSFKTPQNFTDLKDFIGSFAIYGSNSSILEKEGNENLGETQAIINVKNSNKWVKLTDTITISQDLEANQWTDWFTLDVYDTDTNIWSAYKYYLIEIYSFRDQVSRTIIPGNKLIIGEIRAMYGNQRAYTDTGKESIIPGRSSYIYYANNNYMTLRIPYNATSTKTNNLQLPSSFEFYNYDVKVVGINPNNYNAGEVYQYITYLDSEIYTFNITITNSLDSENGYSVTLQKGGNESSSILRGSRFIEVSSQQMTKNGSPDTGGALITITSTTSTNLYSNYTGNFYSNTDIQKSDLTTIEQYNHFTTYLEFKQPKIKNIYVDISVEYENLSTMNDVRNNIITAINKLFEITPYCLGQTFSVSDLWKTVALVEGVKRIIVNSPTDNIKALPYELIALPANNLTIRNISEYDSTELRIKD